MDAYTLRLSEHTLRYHHELDRIIDVSPTGDPHFAPSLATLKDLRYRRITATQFADRFYAEMRHSFNEDPQHWLDTLRQSTHVGLACRCPIGKLCHRHFLPDIFQKIAVYYQLPFRFHGEVPIPPNVH